MSFFKNTVLLGIFVKLQKFFPYVSSSSQNVSWLLVSVGHCPTLN